MGVPARPGAIASIAVERAWFCGGLVFVCLALAYLEFAQPYYFAQDDNFAVALPAHLLGCRAFFDGHFPTYNPYQFLGAPLNTTGCYMFFYPFLYAAYAIARWGLGNANATEDVFCIGHLLAGFAACWLLTRTCRLRPWLACLTSTCFSLSGFSLIAGRSWDNTTPLVAYLPLTFVLLIRLTSDNSQPFNGGRWIAAASMTVALFMNAGFVQLWLYAMIFGAIWLTVVLTNGRLTLRRAAWVVPALIIALAFCTPLLLSFRQSTEGWTRSVAEGPRIVESNLLNMILPAPLAPPVSKGPQAFRWGSAFYKDMGELYYAGSILTIIGILSTIAAIALLVVKRGRRDRLWQNAWGVIAVVALVCGFGSQGPIWPLMRHLPLMSQMESPFKFAPYVNLFLLMQGASTLERYLAARRSSRLTAVVLTASTVLLLCWHITLARPAFYTYGDRPYPVLPPAEENLLDGGRIFAIAPFRSPVAGFTPSLSNDWATVYGVPAAFGYDPPIEVLPSTNRARALFARNPEDALRACGVHWVIVHRTAVRPVHSANPLIRDLESVDPTDLPVFAAACSRRRPALVTPDIYVFEVPNVDPLAFTTSGKRPLAVHMSATGVDIDLPEDMPAGNVVVNFALRRGMRADVDGKPVGIAGDSWGRIVVDVPAGGRRLSIRYTLPWPAASVAGLALLFAGIGLAGLLKRRTPQPVG